MINKQKQLRTSTASYSELKDKGLEPWLDKESILPGQIWRDEISEAVKNSHYFMPVLSSNSVERGGYVKKGLKEDLDILDEMSYSKEVGLFAIYNI